MGILQSHLAIWFGLVATLSSVAGAMLGYWLGSRLGRPIANRLFPESVMCVAEGLFRQYGMWAVLIAAFTPIPYKVFAISAGILELDRRTFFVVSLIGRGARFITIGVLILAFGEQMQEFIVENFEIATLVLGVVMVGFVAVWVLVHRWSRVWRGKDITA